MGVILNNPIPNTIDNILQNTTFKLNSTINCTGTCGNVSAYALINSGEYSKEIIKLAYYNSIESNIHYYSPQLNNIVRP